MKLCNWISPTLRLGRDDKRSGDDARRLRPDSDQEPKRVEKSNTRQAQEAATNSQVDVVVAHDKIHLSGLYVSSLCPVCTVWKKIVTVTIQQLCAQAT